MMTLRKLLLSVYRRHRYTNFEWKILVQKAEMLSFISNFYIEPCFGTEKETLKTRGIKIIHLYLHVLPSLTSDCHCKMPKFSGQSLILVVGASCK